MTNTAENIQGMSLIKKLAKVRAIADVVLKSKKGFNYTYSDITEILAKVTAGMNKYGISLIPNIEPGTVEVTQNVVCNTKFDKTGKAYDQTVTEMLVKGDMSFLWINDDNPSDTIKVPWLIVGMQSDPSQAFGSGLTYCKRYFLTNYFHIAQSDSDVDAYRSKQKAAEASEDKAIAEEIIGRFDTVLKKYLADNPDKSEEVKKFVTKFAKNGNYLAIKEPSLAAKLTEDFNKVFLNKEGEK